VKFTHLTFDCYGTLIDWRNGLESNLGGLLKRKGLPRDERVYSIYVKLEAEQEGKYRPYKEIMHDTAVSVADHFHISITDEEATQFAESISTWPPFPDTVASLRKMGERGFKRVILSNIDRDLLEKTVTQKSLAIDGHVTAEDVGSYKPSTAHWMRFFEKYKVSKDKTLHVAQSIYHDIFPCNELGLACAWINRYGDVKPPEVNPTFTYPNLSDLLTALN